MNPKRCTDTLTPVLHNVILLANMICIHTHLLVAVCCWWPDSATGLNYNFVYTVILGFNSLAKDVLNTLAQVIPLH